MLKIKPSVSKNIAAMFVLFVVAIWLFVIYFYNLEGVLGFSNLPNLIVLLLSIVCTLLGLLSITVVFFSGIDLDSAVLTLRNISGNEVIPIKTIKSIYAYRGMQKGEGLCLIIKSEQKSINIRVEPYNRTDISMFLKELVHFDSSIALNSDAKSIIENPYVTLRQQNPDHS